ncbi:FAD-dependent oxidoreductase [Arcanobacterium phocisimile]|uniref:FAD-dependent oxidoreductase n=1 Tax=Arcanobacterium phocisimile TaxID=1302235 RepID=A0ABX7II42_9ACTO|nr:FAD-dependent oxidoreductase [Arcanobacterium phocisimile]QRV02627.1 FAD-dependent oxidoreductase [Arcanobacterium phocisimile]
MLVAVSRAPTVQELGLEAVDIEADERGFIKVDSHLRISVPSVYAVGDANGGLRS